MLTKKRDFPCVALFVLKQSKWLTRRLREHVAFKIGSFIGFHLSLRVLPYKLLITILPTNAFLSLPTFCNVSLAVFAKLRGNGQFKCSTEVSPATKYAWTRRLGRSFVRKLLEKVREICVNHLRAASSHLWHNPTTSTLLKQCSEAGFHDSPRYD